MQTVKNCLTTIFVSVCLVSVGLALAHPTAFAADAPLTPTSLRCEYLENPIGIDVTTPRFSWKVESTANGQSQVAYRLLVASRPDKLAAGEGDLMDSGKVESDETLFIEYKGEPLKSRMHCYWKVAVWGQGDDGPNWSEPAHWSMGLLNDSDWTADYISYQDDTPVSTDTKSLYLPAARQYRKDFQAEKQITRATVYATALGIYELHLNGKRVGDAFFAPGWTDYNQRAYYNTYDVTDMVEAGDNAIGAWVAEGWYSGYVGFGLLTGMGTEKTGRATYGKTPSVMVQLELVYSDGSTKTVVSDESWKVTGEGPIQQADLLMGEAYDARREMPLWANANFDDREWKQAILAQDNGDSVAMFYQARNPTEAGKHPRIEGSKIDLGFKRPKLEAFPGVPVRRTEVLPAKTVTRRGEGTFIFDLGQNMAGTIRMKIANGVAGQRIRIRYGEMLHPDGRLMTENLRKARATDFYTCSGDPEGETYTPRFTFHGFQFVEVSNFPVEKVGTNPPVDTIEGWVLHSDTPMTSTFACSDPMVNQLFSNVLWTQRANFIDLPTDCPQRDERMGWTGDAQAYIGTAAYNADIGAFYTKWLRELMESQRPSGAFPGYAPMPFQHGWDFGSAWADAGVICPWTMWQAYGDTRVIEQCWEPMSRFMQWRKETSVDDLGIVHGNAWGDWLAQGATTPLDYVDTIYLAISAKMMSEMATATGRIDEAEKYREQFERTKAAFAKKYLNEDGSINVKTQSAHALALFADLIPESKREATGQALAKMIEQNGNRMSTGFLGTRPLLPVLSSTDQHDLATFLLQSRDFPSWGYEISNGATTIWERWDSYTKEDAFGRHNAAMNSFSHYAFGAVCEWMFATLAGIRSDGPGYKSIIIAPNPPSPQSNAMHEPIDWVRATYDSIRGPIKSSWKLSDGRFSLDVTIPANTTATVYLPTSDTKSILCDGMPIEDSQYVTLIRTEGEKTLFSIGSGSYAFTSNYKPDDNVIARQTFEPADNSLNPDEVDLSKSEPILVWKFANAEEVKSKIETVRVNVVDRDGKVLVQAAGNDSQMIKRLETPVKGPLTIVLRAAPTTGASIVWFWSNRGTAFSPEKRTARKLKASETLNDYIFKIGNDDSVEAIRFDPFETYDEHADKGEMQIESVTVYQLQE